MDDEDDYSLTHHHHHMPSAYLQLSGGKTVQDSPPLSPGDHRTLTEPSTLTPSCAYCPIPTPGVGGEFARERPISAGVIEDQRVGVEGFQVRERGREVGNWTKKIFENEDFPR